MLPFSSLLAKAVPLPIVNIDTDMIIPKQFLKTIKRTGLGEGLFFELRYDLSGKVIEDFPLNQPRYTDAKIVLAGPNFGCGSSREHAPWALLDYGFRCVIASSFADIFFNNCFKNGILPVVLKEEEIKTLMACAEAGEMLGVDLPGQTVSSQLAGKPVRFSFEIEPFRKRCLLEGLDDIGLTLQKAEAIATFEAKQKREQPWLWG